MLSSLVPMLPCSMVRCAEGGEGGKIALIDQCAVAAGKKKRNASYLDLLAPQQVKKRIL